MAQKKQYKIQILTLLSRIILIYFQKDSYNKNTLNFINNKIVGFINLTKLSKLEKTEDISRIM